MAANDAKTSLHPVYTVTNIQNKVPILDGTKVTYSSWLILFKLHARGYKVLAHIDGTDPPANTAPEYEQWAEIDSIVLQWIYGTLSDDLLVRVLEPDSTAFQAWEKIKHIFLKNKGSRAAALEHQFTNLTFRFAPPPPWWWTMPAAHATPRISSARTKARDPTDIGTAFYFQTQTMYPKDDPWYMDAGASCHLTPDLGHLAHFSNHSHIKSVEVANGELIRVMGAGKTTLTTQPKPLVLNQVLYTPKVIANLVSVRQFTIDNNVSVEFDPFGFSVKDLQNGKILARHNSKSSIYPFTSTSSNRFTRLMITKFSEAKDRTDGLHEKRMRESSFKTWILRMINWR